MAGPNPSPTLQQTELTSSLLEHVGREEDFAVVSRYHRPHRKTDVSTERRAAVRQLQRARDIQTAPQNHGLLRIWSSHALHHPRHQTSSIHVHCIPTALHACKTWKCTPIIRQKLDVFHQRCLRTILGISWRDHITNDEVLRRVDLGSLSEIVRQRRLRFAGHILYVCRKTDQHIWP